MEGGLKVVDLRAPQEPHRNNFRACKVCLCGKSQVGQRAGDPK